MTRRRCTVALAALLVLAACTSLAAPAGAARRPIIGIGDQKLDMFGDARLTWLGVRHARLVVPWYLELRGSLGERGGVRAWLGAARAAGVRPVVGFGTGYRRRWMHTVPSARRYRRGFAAFRRAYPDVREYIAWNEANRCDARVRAGVRRKRRGCVRPRDLAAYYDAMRRGCRRCRVVAGAFVTARNLPRFVRRFRRAARYRPRLWALHNYSDVNRLRWDATTRFLRLVRGGVWLTETGGIVRRAHHRNRNRAFPETARHAGRVTRYLLRRASRDRRRIKRVYVYHWNTGRRRSPWDTALLDRRGRPRAAFAALARYLGRRP